MKIKKIIVSFILLSSFFLTSLVNAQENESKLKVIDVASVNILDVSVIEQKENKLKIGFRIKNSNEYIPNLKYVIYLKDQEDKIFAIWKNDGLDKIEEGALKTKQIDFEVPQNLSGKYNLLFEVRNDEGLLLGQYDGSEVEIAQNTENKILIEDCRFDVNGGVYENIDTGRDFGLDQIFNLSCNVHNISSERVEYRTELEIFNRSIAGKQIEIKDMESFQGVLFPAQDKRIILQSPILDIPGAYKASLKLLEKNSVSNIPISNIVLFHYVLKGEKPVISNIKLNSNIYNKNEKIEVDFIIEGSPENFISENVRDNQERKSNTDYIADLILSDGSNEVCAKKEALNLNTDSFEKKATLDLKKTCLSPSLKFLIKNNQGEVLTEKIIQLDSQKSESEEEASDNKFLDYKYLIILAVLIVIAVIVVFIIKIRNKNKIIN